MAVKTWKVLAQGGSEGVTESAVAASSRSEARQLMLRVGVRSFKEQPVVVRAIPEAVAAPGVVFRKRWTDDVWSRVDS